MKDIQGIVDLSSAFYGSAVLFAAIDCGVFEQVERGELDTGARGMRLLADACVAPGLLEKKDGVYAAFSGDGARTPWTGERLLFPWYQWDFGYPSSVQLGDGSVLTVFYAPEKAGGSCVIKSARWKPEMK